MILSLKTYNVLLNKHNDKQNKNSNETNRGYENEKKVLKITNSAELSYDISNPKILADNSDYIAIIKVDSIDGASHVNRVTNKPVLSAYTYGHATVLTTLKGDINNKSIKFRRSGVTISYEEWLKGDIDPEKLESTRDELGLNNVSPKDIIVEYTIEGDISIEAGKTYLVYMYKGSTFDVDKEYIIIGYECGLREVENSNTVSYSSDNVNKIKVKNNRTNKWENLSDIVVLNKE